MKRTQQLTALMLAGGFFVGGAGLTTVYETNPRGMDEMLRR